MDNGMLNELVARWLNKPTFRLEDEPGYEGYREKLLLYRLELQKNAKIKALQEQIIAEEKDQWARFPVPSLADDPELSLFKEELQQFCDEMIAKNELAKKISLLNDIRRTFLEEVEQFIDKSQSEKLRLLRMYQNIDLSIINPETPGLENLKVEINNWVEVTKGELETTNNS